MIYGSLPCDLGKVDLSPTEMMFWLYCPIQTPHEDVCVPANLRQFLPILDAVWNREGQSIGKRYVYLTAKTLFVSPGCIGNRPGWHSDGFGTDDINYIWYDRASTEFLNGMCVLSKDHAKSMEEMELLAKYLPTETFPEKHLLRLTAANIHRCPVNFDVGIRSFVKVSISDARYNLDGNSINYGLRERWPLVARSVDRNHPIGLE